MLATLGFLPTSEQNDAIGECSRFLTCTSPRPVMVLRGCAGTGKTLLASTIVRTLARLRHRTILLAPTGRAAKVLARESSHAAYTIHRHIYQQKTFTGDMSGFHLRFNNARHCLFIVDEASMVSNDYGGDNFGSGRLLDDLIQFVYSQPTCRLMLIGDHAQLPPVGQIQSPALLTEVLSAYGLQVFEATMNEVMRQSRMSGILWNASHIRSFTPQQIAEGIMPKVRITGFADIHLVSGEELIDSLGESLRRVGADDVIVVTRSNRRATLLNKGIRNMLLDREEELEGGDMIMIVRNNYFWLGSEQTPIVDDDNRADDAPQPMPDFIANGDRAVVRRLRNQRELYGFRFADATMTFPDYDNMEITATILLDTLHTDAPALEAERHEKLFHAVCEDYAHISSRAEMIKQVKQDPHFNALQIKYAYAVTCHKAQGGQWAHAYIDQGYITPETSGEDYIHWLYTAFTRASEHLFLINWPEDRIDSSGR